MALWQVYRSHQITALKVPGFQLYKSTVYETEIKPLLGAEFSRSLNQQTQFAVSFAPVRGFATLAVCNLTGGYVLPMPLSSSPWFFQFNRGPHVALCVRWLFVGVT